MSTEKLHGLYEGAELVQYSYETVIKCFERKLTNKTNSAYEGEKRHEKLYYKKPEQQNSTFKTLTILKTKINSTKKKQNYHPRMQIFPRPSDSILSNKFIRLPKSSILAIL